MKPRHIPLRSCTVCGVKVDRAGLVRIVRGATGEAEIDLTRSRSGRGAYICQNEQCWTAAINGTRLTRILSLSSLAIAKQQLVRHRDGVIGREERGSP